MLKTESDFLTWTSFPSSIKLINDEGKPSLVTRDLIKNLAVTPGKTLKIEVNAKQQGVAPELATSISSISHVVAFFMDSTGKILWRLDNVLPVETFDWKTFIASKMIEAGVNTVTVRVDGGPGYPDKPGITWYDDLRVYQDGVLIYSDDFSNWVPYTIPIPIIIGLGLLKYLK